MIHQTALGDFILAWSLAVGVRRRWPAGRVDVLGRASIASLADGRGDVDRVVDADAMRLAALFGDGGQPTPELADLLRRYDLVLNLVAGPEEPFSRRLARGCTGVVYSLDVRPRGDRPGHITDQWRANLAAEGLRLEPAWPRLTFPAAELTAARNDLCRLLRQSPALNRESSIPLALLHPGSGGRTKCWPIDRFEQLAFRLRALDWCVGFAPGPVEREQWDAATFERLAAAAPVLPDADLPTSARWAAAADLYVGNDAGMTHVAAATGVRTVAVYGPTDPARWRPLGPQVVTVGGGEWPDVETALAAAVGDGPSAV